MKGKFIYIEYYALRDNNGEFLGTLEVSQDLTEKRALEGEQRILSYRQQTATVGEIPVHQMVNTLRQKVGQDVLEGIASVPGGEARQPSWLNPEKIVKQLDARPIIEQGGHPLGDVLTDIRDLAVGDIYELITPFLPAPLIERVVDQGFDAWSKKESENLIKTYFLKKG
jgi:hypothetical protein